MALNSRSRMPRGFTLIELLVVVAIIAVLIGILIPSLGAARERAKAAKCAANMKQWGTGVALYAAANNECIPAKGDDGSVGGAIDMIDDLSAGPHPLTGKGAAYWFQAIPAQFNSQQKGYFEQSFFGKPHLATAVEALPYGGMNSLFVCPSTDVAVGQPGEAYAPGSPYFRVYFNDAVSSSDALPSFMCYVWNSKIFKGKVAPSGAASGYFNYVAIKQTTFQTTSDQIIMVEKRMRVDEVPADDHLNPVYVATQNAQYNNFGKTLAQPKGDWNRFTTRHLQGGNITFVDGHVELVKYHDVNNPLEMPGGANAGNWNRPGTLQWTYDRSAKAVP